MIHKAFFAQNIMQTQPMGNVIFTVKLWELDKLNDFVDTEIMPLQNITVKIDGVEKLTNASGEVDFNLAPGTYTYQAYKMDVPLTTIQGEIEIAGAVNVDVKLYGCKYTPAEVSDMIGVEGYIPVASADEMYNLRNNVSQVMGIGTIWQGTYTTGLDKKYVQVKNIDLSNWGIWEQPADFTGGFDGNDLAVLSLYTDRVNINSRAFFHRLIGTETGTFVRNMVFTNPVIFNNIAIVAFMAVLCSEIQCDLNNSVIVENIKIINCDISSIGAYTAAIASRISGAGDIQIKNINITGLINDTSNLTGAITAIYGTGGNKNLKIINCKFTGDITGTGASIGGLVGSGNYIDFQNCTVNGDVEASLTDVGGIIGTTTGSDFINCNYSGNITGGTNRIGGIAGDSVLCIYNNCHTSGSISGSTLIGGITGRTNNSTFSDSSSSMNITGVGSRIYCGGFVGYTITNGCLFTRCFATGNVSGNGAEAGGFVGYATLAADSFIDCYARGNVSAGTYAGGFCGRTWTSAGFTNCYSTGLVTGGANSGGFLGNGAAVITNSYYDTQTSGRSDTGKGLPRTTAQMKQGTADSFILPAGGVDGDSLAANAMYTAWDDAVWEFTPDNEYPKLK
jgi:hypothetical protein